MGIWLKRLSIISLLGFPLAVIGKRLGLFDFGLAMGMTAVTLLLALVIFVLGLLVMFWQRESNPQGSKSASTASMLSLIPLLGIGWQIFAGLSVPKIHNISTDVVNPPEFARVAQIRSADNNPLEYDPAKLAKVQQSAYPNVKTLYTDMPYDDAHKRALVIADALGWEVIDDDVVSGIIEATETTALWGFKDDVVIRLVKQDDGKVAVDLRSVSRVGQSDIGANAKRIEAFIAAFEK